jgi:hypothetical protein
MHKRANLTCWYANEVGEEREDCRAEYSSWEIVAAILARKAVRVLVG